MDEQPSEHIKLHGTETNPIPKVKTGACINYPTVAVLVVSVIFLIVGIVLVVISTQKREDAGSSSDSCGFTSNEGRRLSEFLTKTKRIYFALHPHKIYYDYNLMVKRNYNMEHYKAYNPTPEILKSITDSSRKLSVELQKLNLNQNKLGRRERIALGQAKHYLQHTFGQSYDVNYYAGDWMMGPNLFCMNPICEVKDDIAKYLQRFKPHNLDDIRKMRTVLKGQRAGIEQYMENMRLGVKVGMVRSVDACQAGTNAVKQRFKNISMHQEKGVLTSTFVREALMPNFLSMLSRGDQYKWLKEFSLSVKQTIRRDLIEFVGKPIYRLIRFLEEEHIRHCVPSSVSSGLGRLPLHYVYLDQQRTDKTTTRLLPTGEKLNGTKSYEIIMSYFTTTNVTPVEVNRIGFRQLHKLYSQVLEIAKNVTKLSNGTAAMVAFLKLTNSSDFKINKENFPENESNAKAYEKCGTVETAKAFCPKRWQAMQRYWNKAKMVLNTLISKTVPMFYFNGEKITVPVCPVEMAPGFNPSIAAESYRSSDKMCSKSAVFSTPFFVENFRATYDILSVTAHETVPGHHTQVQGYQEHFRNNCGDIGSWLERHTYYDSTSEGWATYAENPLVVESGIYDAEPMQKYGMLKGQIFRALRLIVDTGLHYEGITRMESLNLFNTYLWDNSDFVKKEVTRYQSVFGQATAYMIGKLHIEKLRRYAKEKLGDKFSLKEFHYQLLSQGYVPLEYLTEHIHDYVKCELNNSKDLCGSNNNRRAKRSANDYKNVFSESQLWTRRLHYY